MITVKVSEFLTLGISFRHEETEAPIANSFPTKYRPTKVTYCELFEILSKTHKKYLCEGEAVLGKGDVFRKETGRKYSLTRALKKLNGINVPKLTKKERELVWDGYFKRGEVKPEAYEVH